MLPLPYTHVLYPREYQTLTNDHYLQLTDISSLSPSSNPLVDNFTYTSWVFVQDTDVNYEYIFSINSGSNRYLAFTIAKSNRFEVYYRSTNTNVQVSRQIVRMNFNVDGFIFKDTWHFISVTFSYPDVRVSIDCIQLSLATVVYFDGSNNKQKDQSSLVMPFPFAGFTPSQVVNNMIPTLE